MPNKIDLGEALGRAAGLGLAPLALAGAALRDARLFHPRGMVCRATAVATSSTSLDVPVLADQLAARLAGPVLLRVSGGFWKTKRELPDVLGIALRFRSASTIDTEVGDGDQDLLFVSAPHILSLGISALTTDQHDYLNNRYFAISPYQVEGLGRVKFSLEPLDQRERRGESRSERLITAMEAGEATLRLWLTDLHGRRMNLADIRFDEQVMVDQEQLRFSPFNAGRGLDPSGFVHGLRWATYLASRWGERARHVGHAVRT